MERIRKVEEDESLRFSDFYCTGNAGLRHYGFELVCFCIRMVYCTEMTDYEEGAP